MEVMCELGRRRKIVIVCGRKNEDVLSACAKAFDVNVNHYRCEMYRNEWCEWVEVDAVVTMDDKPKLRLVADASDADDHLSLADVDTLPAESEPR